MKFGDRKREFLIEPIFDGCPISWAQKFFNQEFRKYREKHQDFDTFLIKLGEYLKNNNDGGFNNLIQMVQGEIESNWISPHGSMIRTIIKIYNYCFSPKQAFDYISKCYLIYKKMKNRSYNVSNEYQIEEKISRWDGKRRKFIYYSLTPHPVFKDRHDYYWFVVVCSTIVFDDGFNSISAFADTGFKIRCQKQIFKDALFLFVYFQDKDFFRKVFWDSMNFLRSENIIKEVGIMKYSWGEARLYEFKDDIGYHKIETLKLCGG